MRARIQVSFEGQNLNVKPIELHEQALNHYENRFYEHFEEDRTAYLESDKSSATIEKPADNTVNLALNEVFIGESLSAR